MDINCNNGFLGETVNITFAAIEVSILVAYLIVTSIYQVVITSLSNGIPDLKNRVSLINTKQRLRMLRFISVLTSFTVLVSVFAVIIESQICDYISICSFILIIICFTVLLVMLINNLLNYSEKKQSNL